MYYYLNRMARTWVEVYEIFIQLRSELNSGEL